MNNYDADVYDPTNHAYKVNLVSGTINAAGQATVTPLQAWPDPKGFIGLVTIVGSLSPAAGNITLDPGSRTGVVGNVTLSDSKGFIGLTTTVLGASQSFVGIVTVTNKDRTITGNVTLSDAKTFIGLTTTTLGASPAFVGIVTVANPSSFSGNVTLDAGSKTQIVGNLTLSDPKGFIGLVTVVGSLSPAAGNITLDAGSKTQVVGTVTIQDGGNSITVDGNVGVLGNVTLSDSKGYIGLVTATIGNSPNVSVVGNVTLSDSKTFIGLVTSVSRNAGTTKTLIPLTANLGNNSLLTVAVPTNANKINLTQLVLNSNITTEIALKSGVTYMTGNASIGVTIFPGGGFVISGSPDSPSWIGCASGALVIEKRDGGGTVSKIGGGLIYFDE